MFSYENERFFIVLKQTIPTEIPKTNQKNTRLKDCITKREKYVHLYDQVHCNLCYTLNTCVAD